MTDIKAPKDTKVLIVGGGIGGMSSAIMLKRAGFLVDLIDLDPDWRVYGAGISITGATLRAYKRLGLLDDLAKYGAICGDSNMFSFDGKFIGSVPNPSLEEGLPSSGGIIRSDLHKLMQARIKTEGVQVRLGLTVTSLEQIQDLVHATFSDGKACDYDLVIGADGVNSGVRKLMFAGAEEPVTTGQGAWRVSMKRAPGVESGEFYYGHQYPCGLTLCGPDTMYLWLLTPHEPGLWVDEDNGAELLKERLADFGGSAGWVRDNMDDQAFVNYRPLEAVLQPGPWCKGHIALVGDSAHATTPHLASGAGMAVEDAIVLAEELSKGDKPISDALLAYNNRRYERCRFVVEKSVEIGKAQLEGTTPDKIASLMGEALHVLAENPFES